MPTTIQLSHKTKSLISTFGSKEDTYDTIVMRLYDIAVKDQLRELLLSSKDALSLDEARKLINE
ncbi:TPA: hypothetical protein HA278_02450 [Candidatus Woesearchaeota archaeon]|nr:hypothetical protein [archaeon]HIJ10895.1 hypothetical protein [Candidatus Woesearchaeota archaeon]